jgi:anti-sigma factor RsiW
MNEMIGISTCERGDDLVSFLYGETNERETHEFEKHLEGCRVCRSELASFGEVRESISMWKEEALSTSAPPRVDLIVREKSARAAIRQFSDLSPLWLKGAAGFAVVALCVVAVLIFVPIGKKRDSITGSNPNGRYSEEDLKQAVAQALKQQAESLAAASEQDRNQSEPSQNETVQKKQLVKPSNPSTQWARKSKPLSRSEREQLATDLRLITTKDDDGLNLLVDRINQEF